MDQNILEKTGKSVDEWIMVLHAQKFEKHGQMVSFLKSEHGVTHGYANYIAHMLRQSDAGVPEADDLVDEQYSKGKEGLRPIYEKLKAEIAKLGDDIEFVPKKASVSVRRKRQFTLIQLSTKTRMDIGLKLPGKELTDRLESSGPFGTMCTHRVRAETVRDVDAELMDWIREAYESAV